MTNTRGPIDCPLCAGIAKMGIPQDATIESVTPIGDDGGEEGHGKTRTIECLNGHLIEVCFSWQRDIDPLIRKLQTHRKIPWADRLSKG